MENNLSLFHKSITGALHEKALCLLSFVQIVCLYAVLKSIDGVNNVKILWLIPLVFIFSFSSIIVWIKAQNLHDQFKTGLAKKDFLNVVFRVSLFFIGIVVVAALLKLLSVHWAVYVVAAGLFATCLLVAMLATTLFNLGLFKTYIFTLDFIRHKPSFISIATLVIILANSYAFSLAKLSVGNSDFLLGFSVFQASATIWVVFFGLAVLTAFFSGILNIFMVLYFLNISNSLKDPEQMRLSLVAQSINLF